MAVLTRPVEVDSVAWQCLEPDEQVLVALAYKVIDDLRKSETDLEKVASAIVVLVLRDEVQEAARMANVRRLVNALDLGL